MSNGAVNQVQVNTKQFRLLEGNQNYTETEEVRKMLQMSDSEWNDRVVNTHDGGMPSRDERSFSSVSNQSLYKKGQRGMQIFIQFADTIGKEDIKVQ